MNKSPHLRFENTSTGWVKYFIKTMKLLITGGTGLLGRRLTQLLQKRGHEVAILSRNPRPGSAIPQFRWDMETGWIDPEAYTYAEGIIHLAGEGIADQRWTDDQKQRIINSRVQPIQWLAYDLSTLGITPKVFVSASAIGLYGGDRGEELLDESSAYGDDFLATCTHMWETAANDLNAHRKVHVRVGIVLATQGGALPKMALPVKYGVGASLGSGKQWMSWIHLDDVCQFFIEAIENSSWQGPYNAVAPNPVRHRDFLQVLAQTLKKPVWLPAIPSFLLRLALGEMAIVVTGSARVQSRHPETINWQFPTLDKALTNLYPTS